MPYSEAASSLVQDSKTNEDSNFPLVEIKFPYNVLARMWAWMV